VRGPIACTAERVDVLKSVIRMRRAGTAERCVSVIVQLKTHICECVVLAAVFLLPNNTANTIVAIVATLVHSQIRATHSHATSVASRGRWVRVFACSRDLGRNRGLMDLDEMVVCSIPGSPLRPPMNTTFRLGCSVHTRSSAGRIGPV
jgi:hypothetical protein